MTRSTSTGRAGPRGRMLGRVGLRAVDGDRKRPGSITGNRSGDANGDTVADRGGDRTPAPVGAPPPADGEHVATWSLVEAAQHGDAEAFGRLYDQYVDSVFRYVLFRVGDRSLAEDVTSETFLRAFRKIESLSYQGRDVGAWFVTIARNIVLDHVKSSRFRLEVATADPDDGNDTQAGPESQVLTQFTHTELLRCVSQLGDDQRECIVLRFLQGLSVAETAAIMGRNARPTAAGGVALTHVRLTHPDARPPAPGGKVTSRAAVSPRDPSRCPDDTG